MTPSPESVGKTSGAERVLFLDIDGVVLNGRALWHSGNNRYLPPEKVALVREVCERSGCVVVVSSTWRFSDTTADQLRRVGLPLHEDWRTPYKNDMRGSIIMGQRRGVEIGRWLARHDVAAYAIVDDDSDMLLEQMPFFVKTDHEEGIEQWHADALVAILTNPTPSITPETPNAN